VGSSTHPCRPYPGIKGHDGKHFLDVGNDWGTATATSPNFKLPNKTDRLCFKRSGGAGPGSGLYLVRQSDGRRLCEAENGEDSNTFAMQCCTDLAKYVGEEVIIRIVDAQSSGWGKVLVDDIRLLDTSGSARSSGERSAESEADVPACGLVQDEIHYDGVHNLGEPTKTPSAEACCKACQDHPHCDAWGWGKARNSWITDKCFLKKLIEGRMPHQVPWQGVVSGLPAKSMRQIVAPSLSASETVEQEGAQFPSGSAVRLYALGSSSMLWMNWIEELHLFLLRLGYHLPTVEAKVKPEFHPRSIQTCDDSMYFDRLRTARFARIGWCSWDFSFEGWSDCDSDGFRRIGGHRVKCQHGPGCSHSMNPIKATEIAEDASMSDITLVATWFNDDQQRWSNYNCFDGRKVEKVEATQLSIPSLLNTVRKIHEKNPKVWVVVLGKYPQVWGHFSYPWFKEVNVRVKAALKDEPRTLFIDYYMPPDNVTNLYQSAHPGHPNCRGSKLITLAVLRKLYEERIIGRGLRLKEPTEENLVREACDALPVDACHTAVTCWVDPADRKCKNYSRGSDEAHAVVMS